MIALTIVNWVVTPQMPSASTSDGENEERFVLHQHAKTDAEILKE